MKHYVYGVQGHLTKVPSINTYIWSSEFREATGGAVGPPVQVVIAYIEGRVLRTIAQRRDGEVTSIPADRFPELVHLGFLDFDSLPKEVLEFIFDYNFGRPGNPAPQPVTDDPNVFF